MTTEEIVKPLRYCSTAGACDSHLVEVYQRIFGQFCDSMLKQEAADLIEQQAAKIAELGALDSDDVRDGNTIKLPREQEKNEWND